MRNMQRVYARGNVSRKSMSANEREKWGKLLKSKHAWARNAVAVDTCATPARQQQQQLHSLQVLKELHSSSETELSNLRKLV